MAVRRLLPLLFLLLLAGCRKPEPPPAALVLEPAGAPAAALLETLRSAPIPARDPLDLARRLGGVDAVPLIAATTTAVVGDTARFWSKNYNNGSSEQVTATLIYTSEQLNLWLQEGERLRESDVAAAAAEIEDVILPAHRALFGPTEPGLDGRLNILYLADIGPQIGGYFSAADQYPQAVNPFSNEQDLLYINLGEIGFDEDEHFNVIAHELQHLSQQAIDANEALWMDEGFSELAALLAGYPTANRAAGYAALPDVSLVNFRQEPDVAGAHYGQVYLWTAYLREQLGVETIRSLIYEEADGAAGIDQALADLGFPLTFDQLFANFTVANYVEGANLVELSQGGPYAYRAISVPAMTTAANHRRLPVSVRSDVSQYGVDYVRLHSDTPVTVVFTGTQQIPLLPTAPAGGDFFWTSYPADRGDMTLTGRFDLRSSPTATLTFDTWYDLEDGWDYAYLAVSDDAGATWTLLSSDGMTGDNPQGNSYGPAFTGRSGGGAVPRWTTVSADLTPFAGQEILLRFEYVTDDAVVEAGWALDNIAIPELGFFDDAEQAATLWEAAGFFRHANVLPQRFVLQALLISSSTLGEDYYQLEQLPLDAQQQGSWTLPLDDTYDEAVLIITATTPVTAQRAGYEYTIRRAGE